MAGRILILVFVKNLLNHQNAKLFLHNPLHKTNKRKVLLKQLSQCIIVLRRATNQPSKLFIIQKKDNNCWTNCRHSLLPSASTLEKSPPFFQLDYCAICPHINFLDEKVTYGFCQQVPTTLSTHRIHGKPEPRGIFLLFFSVLFIHIPKSPPTFLLIIYHIVCFVYITYVNDRGSMVFVVCIWSHFCAI